MNSQKPIFLPEQQNINRQAWTCVALAGLGGCVLVVYLGVLIWSFMPKAHLWVDSQVFEPEGDVSEVYPSARTLTVGNFYVVWSPTNPEEVVELHWNGSANLTNAYPYSSCPGDLEYFGNSWVSENEGTPSFFFGSLVGYGTTGTWMRQSSTEISIDSMSSGCPASADIRVHTLYQFFDDEAKANLIKVERTFEFGDIPYAHAVRPFIPRLYPRQRFTQVLHPDSKSVNMVAHTAEGCGFGCKITNWDRTWFAIHDPLSGVGMIVLHVETGNPIVLWLDEDGGSSTNSTSILLLQPRGGFTEAVTDTEYLCFYDNSIWAPSLTLPPGCQP